MRSITVYKIGYFGVAKNDDYVSSLKKVAEKTGLNINSLYNTFSRKGKVFTTSGAYLIEKIKVL